MLIISIISCVMVIGGIFFYPEVARDIFNLPFWIMVLAVCTFNVSRMLLKMLLNSKKRSWFNILFLVSLIVLNIGILSWGFYSYVSTYVSIGVNILFPVSLIVLNTGILIIWGLYSYYVSTRLDKLFSVSLLVVNIGILSWGLYSYYMSYMSTLYPYVSTWEERSNYEWEQDFGEYDPNR